ncbi:MAG: helix-turn-helix domain-containing protein [Candidatus Zixiibacteriota bacterium]|jgi:excisionase family DNA binding protein
MSGKIFWSLEEISEYLNESPSTVREWVARRKIPYYKRGKRLKFKIEEIEKWDKEKNYRPPLYEYSEN